MEINDNISTDHELDWYRTAFSRTPIGMAHVTLDRQVVQVNPALCTLLGRTVDDLMSLGVQSVTHPEDVDLHQEHHRRLLAREIDDYRLIKRYLHSDGSTIWATLHVAMVLDATGTPHSLVSQLEDNTARIRAEAELTWLATHDVLTGLLSRAGFFQSVESMRVRGDFREVDALFIDLDGLKTVNDTAGHDAGDLVIAAVGRRLAELVPPPGLAARFGGDEFVVLLSSANVPDTVAAINACLTAPVESPNGLLTVGGSIGVASGSIDDLASILRDADQAKRPRPASRFV